MRRFRSTTLAVLLVALFIPALASAELTFAPRADISGATSPAAVSIGDFNGDGKADIAAPNSGQSNVSVLLGSGTGSFSPASGSPFAAGSLPSYVAVSDFNGDGKADIAVTNFGDNNISVLLGNGAGAFSPASGSPFATPGLNTRGSGIGDFNGDGKPDLVVTALPSNNISVLLGNGTGALAQALGSPFAVTNPVDAAAGDFNGDGKTDLAVSSNTGAINVWLGNGMAGFSPAAGSPFTSGLSNASKIAIGDMNGDSKLDLALGSDTGNNVGVLLGNGAGAFSQVVGSPFFAGSTPRSVAIGDIDQDGDPDLAVAMAGEKNVTILLGDGTGSLKPAAGAPYATASNPTAVALSDFNGDAHLDLVIANSSPGGLSVFLQTFPTAEMGPASLSFGSADAPVAQGAISSSQSVTVTNKGTAMLHVAGFELGGPNPDDFFVSGDSCGEPIPAGGSCGARIRFAPAAAGARKATLGLVSDAGSVSETVSLSGIGGPAASGQQNVSQKEASGQTSTPSGLASPSSVNLEKAKIACKVTRQGRGPQASCTVKLPSGSEGALRWRLTHAGTTYGHGLALIRKDSATIEIQGERRLPTGPYRVRVLGAPQTGSFSLG